MVVRHMSEFKVTLSVRLPLELAELVRAEAIRKEQSLSETVSRCVQEALQRDERREAAEAAE